MRKKWIALLLTLALSLSAPVLARADATALDSDIGNRLGLEILHQLYVYDQQALVSPASLTYALAMAAEGAQGETRAQLLQALGVDQLSLDSLRVTMDSLGVRGVKVANGAFISAQVEPKPAYIDSLSNALDAEIFWFEEMQSVLFEINEWARQKTDGMIDAALDGKPDPELLMVLINALAMDAKWRMPFDEDSTQDAPFHTPAGDVEVPFMRAGGRYLDYLRGDGFQATRLPYETDALSMYVILPEEGRMNDTLTALAQNGMALLEGMEEGTYMNLALPKLRLNASNELADPLRTLGLTAPFEGDADFSGILDGSLFIGGITQAVTLEVNEQGTRAAATTAIAMAGGSMPTQEPLDFTVDRPFLLLVYDQETNSILFAAAVSDPTAP